jgi:hypothetical protein
MSRMFPMITHSPCPSCGGPMMLSCIEPADPGYEKRSFSCAACRYQYGVTFRIQGGPVLTQRPAAEGTATALERTAHRDEKGSPKGSADDLVSGPSTSDDVTLH